MGESSKLANEIVHLARLALTGTRQDVELFSRRLVRKLSKLDNSAAQKLTEILSQLPRRNAFARQMDSNLLPVDKDSRLGLLKIQNPTNHVDVPILESSVMAEINFLIEERKREDELLKAGVEPGKAVLFVGPPGVGKTLSAQFISHQLGIPLLTLDLSAVMSSYLGRTGANIRSIFDFAKSTSAVLLLDELDAIAKKRNDEAELGELKRLVTVLLQDLDNWPSSNLLIAATNHEELLDPAIWRRFDRVIKFTYPKSDLIRKLLTAQFKDERVDIELLTKTFEGLPHATIITEIQRIKRLQVLTKQGLDDILMSYIENHRQHFGRDRLREIARILNNTGRTSQRRISAATGVSRDTIRKLETE